jgi:outer membrane murein-binding lipoprotein Lpp
MLPLVETFLQAEKTLVFQGARASAGVSMNPSISAELVNTSGMKLPAGPITVYDGGTYAGDALIEFFPENEKRLISYGDDLTVTGSISLSNSRNVTSVTILRGIMTINRKVLNERTYNFRNASGEEKKLIIEHPITYGASLTQPQSYDESTSSLYRFNRILPANRDFSFTVIEETPVYDRIILSQLRTDAFLSYTTNQEIPQNVRAALIRAVELRAKMDEASQYKQSLEDQYSRLFTEQDRIRRNLEAAGSQTPQGQDYLRRMAAIDTEIDALNASIREADQRLNTARKDYEDYLSELTI